MKSNPATATDGFDDSDPQRYRKVKGGGCLTVFGMPFFLVGLLLFALALGIIPAHMEGGAELPVLFISLFGTPFFLVGALLVFGRSGLTIDKSRGSISRWWGLLVPMRSEETPLGLVQAVHLGYDPGDSDSPATYPVELVLDGARAPIAVQSGTGYPQMRALAERLAALIGKPCEDTSTGQRVVRDPKRLDESLRDRVRRLGEKLSSVPSPPSTLRTRVTQRGTAVTLEIPAPPRSLFHFIPLFFAVIFAAWIGIDFLPAILGSEGSPGVRISVGSFLLLVFVVGPILLSLKPIVWPKSRHTVVTADRAGLQVEEWSGEKCKRTEIPVDELEDLLAPAPGITAVSDRGTVTFGEGLSAEEVTYLHALVRWALVSE